MKKWILILVVLGVGLGVKAQNAAFEPYGTILLQDDTINITRTDAVYMVSIYVGENSTDSCGVMCKYFTIDDIATDTIWLEPDWSFTIGGAWSRRLDSVTIISPSADCDAFITIMK